MQFPVCWSKAVSSPQWLRACPIFREQLVTHYYVCVYVLVDTRKETEHSYSKFRLFLYWYTEKMLLLYFVYNFVASQTSIHWIEGKKQTFSPWCGLNCIPQNSYVEALSPRVTIFRDRTCEEVIKVKWGSKGGTLDPLVLVTLWEAEETREPSLYAMWPPRDKTAVHKPGRELLSGTK